MLLVVAISRYPLTRLRIRKIDGFTRH